LARRKFGDDANVQPARFRCEVEGDRARYERSRAGDRRASLRDGRLLPRKRSIPTSSAGSASSRKRFARKMRPRYPPGARSSAADRSVDGSVRCVTLDVRFRGCSGSRIWEPSGLFLTPQRTSHLKSPGYRCPAQFKCASSMGRTEQMP
jgi:hypothetical protein